MKLHKSSSKGFFEWITNTFRCKMKFCSPMYCTLAQHVQFKHEQYKCGKVRRCDGMHGAPHGALLACSLSWTRLLHRASHPLSRVPRSQGKIMKPLFSILFSGPNAETEKFNDSSQTFVSLAVDTSVDRGRGSDRFCQCF